METFVQIYIFGTLIDFLELKLIQLNGLLSMECQFNLSIYDYVTFGPTLFNIHTLGFNY